MASRLNITNATKSPNPSSRAPSTRNTRRSWPLGTSRRLRRTALARRICPYHRVQLSHRSTARVPRSLPRARDCLTVRSPWCYCSSLATNIFPGSPSVTHDEYAHRQGTESQSSTAVDSDSHNASMMTLPVESYRNDSIARIKESTLHTSPVRAISSHAVPKAKQMPFSPDDLSRALNAAQICT